MRVNWSPLLLGATALANAQSQYKPQSKPIEVDVAVIGAGLSGLAAARTLLDSGKSVHVIEARDRVGGRVENQKLKNGGITELGAAFVGPTQDRVLALAEEVGTQTLLERDTGSNVALIDGQRLLWTAEQGLPPLDDVTLSQVVTAITTVDEYAASLDIEKPWTHKNASKWDAITLKDFRDSIVKNQTGRDALEVVVESIWSARSDELSFLYALTYIAGAGNATEKGTFERLFMTTNGAQERRIVGGTALLPERLADKIGRAKILLNDPVQSIKLQSSGKYQVRGKKSTILASSVIVAMSPPVARQINYSPPLSKDRQAVSEKTFMGSIGKANAIYSTPFWRHDNLSGQVISTEGTVRTTFDASDENGTYGAILGFIEADQMRELDNASDDEIISRVTKDYVKYFGPQAAMATEWVIKKWDNEKFSRGGPTALAGKGVISKYGKALREPCGGIHWTGTESSDYWNGYMDGAIRSGERAAKEILAGK